MSAGEWLASLGPEIIKAIILIMTGGVPVALWKARQADKIRKAEQPVRDSEATVKLTQTLQDVARQSVEFQAAELAAARVDLNSARSELRAARDEIGLLRRVIDRLISVLDDYQIPVPDEVHKMLGHRAKGNP